MGSCCSTSRGMNENIVGVTLDTDVAKKEVKSRDSSSSFSSSGRWKMIGSISKRKFGTRKHEGYGQSDQSQSQIHIAGKMCGNGASEVACLYTQQGKKGTNQDAMIVWENYTSRSDTIFCGVFDGHGPFGHMVARKVRDSLPLILYTQWDACSNGDEDKLCKIDCPPGNKTLDETLAARLGDQWCEPLATEEGEKFPEMYQHLKLSVLKAFNLMDMELKLHPTTDCFCSGTTAVTLIKQGRDLVIGNVGDSRAVLARRDLDDSLVAVQLTVDLKPDLPREAARILQCKGRVFALQDEPEVARVWLPDSDSPGLAMARAFGDFCLKDFGLISVPDVYYLQLTERDEFVILATDGVWDVLSNKEAINIVASAPGRATAARALVDCAVRAWRLKYPTSKNDDCAVVCLFLDHIPSVSEAALTNDVTGPPQAGAEVAATVENQEIINKDADYHDFGLGHSLSQGLDEIVPVSELIEENPTSQSQRKPKKSLAECILTDENEEWSALEGVTRVNSLLSLPRFFSGTARSASWRKRQ